LEVVYEGDDKVKEAKLQTYRTQFENLKMKEEENIVEYFHRVDEVVNAIRAAGEEITDKPIVKKILRSLPMRYDAKISTIEDRSDLNTLTVDQLHGIFTAYEMRIGNDKSTKNETVFKASKTKINQKQKLNPAMMKNLMWKKKISLKNFRKDQGDTKASCLSNVLTVARLAILQPSVPIPRRTLKMKKTKPNNTRRRKNPTTRKSFTKGKKFLLKRRKQQFVRV
jgi:hypothetical protein